MRPMVLASAVKILRARKYYLTMKQRRLIADLLEHLAEEIRKARRPSVRAIKEAARSDELVKSLEVLMDEICGP